MAVSADVERAILMAADRWGSGRVQKALGSMTGSVSELGGGAIGQAEIDADLEQSE